MIHAESTTIDLVVEDLGRMDYPAALAHQRALHAELVGTRRDDGATNGPMKLVLVEHDPVITVSQRPGSAAHLLASDELLKNMGISVVRTDRGGDITYHGPGQLVVYPILDLRRLGLGVSQYVRLLEEVIIQTLARFGINAERETGATGVWVPGETGQRAEKVAAIGVRVARWVTMHGLALNVTTDLTHFDAIVPCGLVGRRVTSMEQLLGESTPTMDEVKRVIVAVLRERLGDPACGRCERAR